MQELLMSKNQEIIEFDGQSCLYRHLLSQSYSETLFRSHMHNNLEIIYILQGCAVYSYEGNSIVLNAGDIVVTPPGFYHYLKIEKGTMSERINVLIRKKIEFSTVAVYKAENFFFDIFNSLEKYYKIISKDNLEMLFQTKIDEIILILQHLLLLPNQVQIQTNSTIKKIIDYINQNIYNPLTPKSVAKNCYLSEGHLHRVFKKALNTTPGNYILSKKLALAKNLIEKGDDTISNIALKLGFEDYSVFYRGFKKLFNCSPNNIKKHLS